ncbi:MULTISPECIES: restriction endonuclease subunit S [Bacteria]|uniref:restriction endonuclease subunit S n=1 Tax=Bacteria TaxID=2 RepID=UPI001156DD93|nr:restriction endonuclease subunit S [Enterococcus durans]
MSNDTQPEIRFPGFTDDWEQRKLADLAEYYDGTHQTPKYTKSGVPFVSVENINNIKRTDKYISEEDFENQFKIKPQKDDILMTRITAGVIGDTTIVPDNNPLAYYVSLALIRPKKIMASYLEKYIGSNQFKEELHKRIIHTAFPKKINLGEIGQCIVSCPCNDSEQEKIGSFFKQLDKTITLHQRKLDLLKETKKGFLQKMFPKNGAKVPEIRFPGFTEDWEERKLQEVLRERNNQQPQSTEYPLVSFTVENGVTPKTDRYEREQLVVGDKSSKKYKVTVLNDIVYNPANLKFGAISRNKYGNAVFSPIYITFLVNNDVTTPEFIEMFVTRNDFIKRALKYQQGTVYERQSVSPTDLLAMNVYLPGKSEQEKIGSFFQQLDETIALHQRKLDLLKETKKGFLQKMFV